jgi:hypothetical protein
VKRRNSISDQFAARRIEVLESPAYRALSRSAHMVISRIEIELAHHGGNDNRRLPVTTEQFVRYGTHRTSVAPATREAEALGFIQVTERGRGGNAEHRSPNLFYLTYAHTRDSRRRPPTDEWDRIQTLQEAHRIAPAARGNKSQPAVERGKRSWRKQQQKTKPGTANARSSVLNTGTEKAESRFGNPVLLCQVKKPNDSLYPGVRSIATSHLARLATLLRMVVMSKAIVLVGCWPRRMPAELAATYCGEPTVKSFLKRVGSEYPQPRVNAEAVGDPGQSANRVQQPRRGLLARGRSWGRVHPTQRGHRRADSAGECFVVP